MTRSQFESGKDATLAKNGKSTAVYRAAFLCFLVLVLEGYDLGAMSFTLPTLSEVWHLKLVAFTPALTAGSIGLFLGSLALRSVGRPAGTQACADGRGEPSLA